jgi:hypothetical protein
MSESLALVASIRRLLALMLLISVAGWLFGVPAECITFFHHLHLLRVGRAAGLETDSETYLVQYYGALMTARLLSAAVTLWAATGLYRNSLWLRRFLSTEA